MRKSEDSNKGITLISLVITIIILLILAAVSILTLTGDNGILTKAQNAKEKIEIEEIKELLELEKVSYMAEIYEKGEELTLNGYIEYIANNSNSLVKFDSGEVQNINDKKVIVKIKGNIFLLSQDGDIGIQYLDREPQRERILLPIATNVTSNNSEYGEATASSTNVYQQPFHAFDNLD